jgi:hypothetical protein
MGKQAHLRLVGPEERDTQAPMEQALVALTALLASLPANDVLAVGVSAVYQALAWRLGVPAG